MRSIAINTWPFLLIDSVFFLFAKIHLAPFFFFSPPHFHFLLSMFIGPSVICLLCPPTHLLLLVHSTLQNVNTVCNGEIGLYGSAMNSGSKLLSPAAMDNASHCVVLSSRELQITVWTYSHTHIHQTEAVSSH